MGRLYSILKDEIPNDVLSEVELEQLEQLEIKLGSGIDPALDIDELPEFFRQVSSFLTVLNLWVDKYSRMVSKLASDLEIKARSSNVKITVKEVESHVNSNEQFMEQSRVCNAIEILRNHILNLRQLALIRKDLLVEKSINTRADNKSRIGE